MNQDIFSSTHTAQLLLKDFTSQKLSHAYLITGEVGSGKFTLASAFAQLLLCESPNGNTPCGQCACCTYFESFDSHPNVTILSTENKASISVKDVRDMTDGAYTAPYIGTKKIYIIKNADKMTQQAQNALLKMIEEPPEHAIFFLLASSRYAMLTTVISRCRCIAMTPYNKSALTRILTEKAPELSPDEYKDFINRCQGNPGRLITSLSDDDGIRATVLSSANALIKNDMETLLDSVQSIDSRESALKYIYQLNEIIRDACIYKLFDGNSLTFNSDKQELISSIAEVADLKRIVKFLERISDTQKMLNGNVSYLLCLKSLLLKW